MANKDVYILIDLICARIIRMLHRYGIRIRLRSRYSQQCVSREDPLHACYDERVDFCLIVRSQRQRNVWSKLLCLYR